MLHNTDAARPVCALRLTGTTTVIAGKPLHILAATSATICPNLCLPCPHWDQWQFNFWQPVSPPAVQMLRLSPTATIPKQLHASRCISGVALTAEQPPTSLWVAHEQPPVAIKKGAPCTVFKGVLWLFPKQKTSLLRYNIAAEVWDELPVAFNVGLQQPCSEGRAAYVNVSLKLP